MGRSKVIFARKQIHGCFASYSSSDVMLYKRVRSAEAVGEYIEEQFGDNAVTVLVTSPDKEFYDRGLATRPMECATKEEMLVKCKPYLANGWSNITPLEVSDYWGREKTRQEKSRKKAGYIFWKEGSYKDKALYPGGFSKEVSEHPHFIDYTKDCLPFGYIGHSVRKIELDAYLEKAFRALKTPTVVTKKKLLAIFVGWLTSTSGRHFGDSLEGYSFEEQKTYIDENIKWLYNRAYIYILPEHEGSLASTERLGELHKKHLFYEAV